MSTSQPWLPPCCPAVPLRCAPYGVVQDLRGAGGAAPGAGGFQNGRHRAGGLAQKLLELRGLSARLVAARGLLRETVHFTQGFPERRLVAAASGRQRARATGGIGLPVPARQAPTADRTHTIRQPVSIRPGRASYPGAATHQRARTMVVSAQTGTHGLPARRAARRLPPPTRPGAARPVQTRRAVPLAAATHRGEDKICG